MSKEPPKPLELEDEAIEKNTMTTDAPAPEIMVDENGRVLVGREAEQNAVNATSRIEEQQIGKDLKLSRKGQLQNGRQNRGASLSAKIRDAQKEKDKKEKELRSAISEAQKALEARLEELDSELKEIDEGLNAISKLRAFRKSGTFDKDNADHIVLMQNAGITSEEMESPDGGQILDEKEKGFSERRKEIIKESDGLIRQAEAEGYTSEAITKFKENLEQTNSEVAYDIVANQEVPEEVKEAAGKIYTKSQTKETSLSLSSYANALEGLANGITSKTEDLDLGATFAKAHDPNSSSEVLQVDSRLNLEGPKTA
jgi:uncharacterized protein (UPF0147 family)